MMNTLYHQAQANQLNEKIKNSIAYHFLFFISFGLIINTPKLPTARNSSGWQKTGLTVI